MNIPLCSVIAISFVILGSFSSPLYAQIRTVRSDSASVSVVDSTRTVAIDTTLKFRAPIPLVGSIDRSLPSRSILTDSMKNFIDYTYLGNLLQQTPGLFSQELGSAGQMNGFSLNGLDVHNIAFMSDGVPLNDPYTGGFDLSLYPTESIERVEIIDGTRAFVYGLNSTGGAINIVTKSKRSIHPYSRIRYSESGYGFGLFDGTFSQDIVRGMNLFAGAQHATLGGRFPNSAYDAWNGRIKLRYDVSDHLNIFLSESYYHTVLGLNGGISLTTPSALRYDQRLATVANNDAHQNVTRHDLQLGVAATPFHDSSAITTLTLYYSNNLREYRDEENGLKPNGIFLQEDYHSLWYGAKFTQHLPLGYSGVDIGAEVQTRGVKATATLPRYFRTLGSIYVIGEFGPKPEFIFSPYMRFDHYLGSSRLSAGADVNVTVFKTFALYFGLSRSYRYTTIEEMNGVPDTLHLFSGLSEPEEHDLFEIGFSLGEYGNHFLSGSYFHRVTNSPLSLNVDEQHAIDPIILHNQNTYEGFDLGTTMRLGSFVLEGNAQYLKLSELSTEYRFLPNWSATGGLYYWDKLAGNHLDLKIGLRGRMFSSYRTSTYDQRFQLFVPQLTGTIDASNTLDFILIAHLGSAYVNFIWENLLDRNYVMTEFYPMTDRVIRFGVSWEFSD